VVLLTIAGGPSVSGATARPAPIDGLFFVEANRSYGDLSPPPALDVARCGRGGAANARACALVAAACWNRRRASSDTGAGLAAAVPFTFRRTGSGDPGAETGSTKLEGGDLEPGPVATPFCLLALSSARRISAAENALSLRAARAWALEMSAATSSTVAAGSPRGEPVGDETSVAGVAPPPRSEGTAAAAAPDSSPRADAATMRAVLSTDARKAETRDDEKRSAASKEARARWNKFAATPFS
jgi:hypothetical protein